MVFPSGTNYTSRRAPILGRRGLQDKYDLIPSLSFPILAFPCIRLQLILSFDCFIVPILFIINLFEPELPGHFADHPIEDLIEKIACQFTARHIRGRPRPPYWYLGWPLYVCDSRYNDRDRIFVKIKNWNSCVPEEVRKSTEFMPIYPFERMVHPRRFGSPFLMQGQGGKGGGVKGPGGIGEPVSEKVDGEKGGERKRSKRAGPPSGTDISGPSKGLYVGVPGATTGYSAAGTSAAAAQYLQQTQQQAVTPQVARAQSSQPRQPQEDRSIVTAAGGMAVLGSYAEVERLPAETGRCLTLSADQHVLIPVPPSFKQNTSTATRRRTRFFGSPLLLSISHTRLRRDIASSTCIGSPPNAKESRRTLMRWTSTRLMISPIRRRNVRFSLCGP